MQAARLRVASLSCQESWYFSSVQLVFRPHSQPTKYICTCSWIKSRGGTVKKCLVSVPVSKQIKQHLLVISSSCWGYYVTMFASFVALFTCPAEICGYGDTADPASSPSTFRQSSQPQEIVSCWVKSIASFHKTSVSRFMFAQSAKEQKITDMLSNSHKSHLIIKLCANDNCLSHALCCFLLQNGS